jgi:ATP-binding cassette subfamily B protein
MSDDGQQRPPVIRPGGFGGGGGHRGGPMGALGRPVEKAKDFKGTIKRLAGYLKPYYFALTMMCALILVNTAIATASPKILGIAINGMFKFVSGAGKLDMPFIIRMLSILAGLFVFNGIFTYIMQVNLSVIAQKTVYNLRKEMDEKISRLPLKFFDTRTSGEIMSRITNDTENINNALQQGLPQILSSLAGILGAVVMMLVISPLLTLLTIITLPLSFGATMFIAKKSQKYYMTQQKSLGELNGHVEEMLTGHRIVRAFCYEKKSIDRFEEMNGTLYNAGWKAQFISGFIFPMMNFINNLGYVVVCVAGGVMVAKKAIEIGDVQAFIQYIRMFTQPVAQSASMINTLQSAVASAERIFEILNEPEESSDENSAVAPAKPRGAVDFNGIKFGYSADKILFDGLSLKIEPGHTIAIVGPTGAGKTTLVNLLMRFYELNAGNITVDGLDISKLKRGSMRRMFGMVLQDSWLFNGSIRDNIAYGKDNATQDEIVSAAKTARADHFIRALPDGYDTVLNEDASNLSQGEKQLITIARAILANPQILILDEATSSVDTRTELQIQKTFAELMKDRTSFVIAHRLSTIRDAELILVMDHGKIVETGRHEDLLKKNGFYAELYKAQFAGLAV